MPAKTFTSNLKSEQCQQESLIVLVVTLVMFSITVNDTFYDKIGMTHS